MWRFLVLWGICADNLAAARVYQLKVLAPKRGTMLRQSGPMFLLFLFSFHLWGQVIEYGKPDELKGVKSISIYTGTDLEVRQNMIKQISKKLPAVEILDRPDDADVLLVFSSLDRQYLHVPPPIVSKVVNHVRSLTPKLAIYLADRDVMKTQLVSNSAIGNALRSESDNRLFLCFRESCLVLAGISRYLPYPLV
jgi:hypothetical protein